MRLSLRECEHRNDYHPRPIRQEQQATEKVGAAPTLIRTLDQRFVKRFALVLGVLLPVREFLVLGDELLIE